MQTDSLQLAKWSVGCVFGELLIQEPLFPGKSEIEQLNKIFEICGSVSEEDWPGYVELPHAKKIKFPHYPGRLEQLIADRISKQGYDLLQSTQ